jgi:phosphocarrier protein
VAESASRKVKILNRLGLHARPAMAFVDLACTFQSAVTVRRRDQSVDGKSIMQMLMLAATQGTELELVADGPDAAQAIEKLTALVDEKFGED